LREGGGTFKKKGEREGKRVMRRNAKIRFLALIAEGRGMQEKGLEKIEKRRRGNKEKSARKPDVAQTETIQTNRRREGKWELNGEEKSAVKGGSTQSRGWCGAPSSVSTCLL